MRPSAWVEPVGPWGKGSVRLVELHAPDETYDNITAFWVPEIPSPAGRADRAHLQAALVHGPDPPAGRLRLATRIGRTATQERDLERFVVDFDGAYLSKQGPDPLIEPVVTVGRAPPW
jgi:glucans biosynthesis protein